VSPPDPWSGSFPRGSSTRMPVQTARCESYALAFHRLPGREEQPPISDERWRDVEAAPGAI